MTHFIEDDGGRAAAGFKGKTGDCVTRAIAIATGQPYLQVYNALQAQVNGARLRKRNRGSVRRGVSKLIIKRYMAALGWTWVPTMAIGSGCTVHLKRSELPADRSLVVSCSGHLTAMIDGVIHDSYDPSRDGTRCVYGYWMQP